MRDLRERETERQTRKRERDRDRQTDRDRDKETERVRDLSAGEEADFALIEVTNIQQHRRARILALYLCVCRSLFFVSRSLSSVIGLYKVS